MMNIGANDMIEVGIPVYKAKDFLCNALDSLVAQTYKRFITCLSIDGDGEDYTDIIKEYQKRGLIMRIIYSQVNGGPGDARQRVLDTTQAQYLMFLDADDILTPRAVEVLYNEIRGHDYDILRSSFIREQRNRPDLKMASTDNIITWFHGKIYKVQYLKEKGLHFLPGLRTDEDAYFNMVAWNSTKKLGMLDEVTYIWRDNKNSVTRGRPVKEYFMDTHMNYMGGQIQALKDLFRINDQVQQKLLTNALVNLYYYYMRAVFYGCDQEEMDREFSTLRNEGWMQVWLQTGQNWVDVVQTLKGGARIDEENIIFYEEPFNKWAARLFKAEAPNAQ